MTDYPNAEVKGIARYIPTNLSRAILLLLPGLAWFTFAAVREHPEWFRLTNLTELEQTLISALVSMALCVLLVIVLVLDMAVAVHQSKHRRIVHFSNQHPLMSARFLVQNATVKHWLFLGFVCLASSVAGYFFACL